MKEEFKVNESSVLEMESIKTCKNKTVYFAVKRLFDIVVSFLLGIIFLIPLILFLLQIKTHIYFSAGTPESIRGTKPTRKIPSTCYRK